MTHLQFFICLNMIAAPIVCVAAAWFIPDRQQAGLVTMFSAFIIFSIAFGIRLAVIWSR